MKKYKPIILLGVALLVALITSVLTYNWLQKKTAVKEVAFQTQPVAVAATDLSWGTVLNKETIKQVPFLKGSLPEGEYFSDPSSLQGRVLISPVKANEPLLKSRLAPDSISSGGVAAVVDPKKRAMAVHVDKVIGVSGFVHPGHRVDILVTLTKTDKNATPITKIVLQNILVLAVGIEFEQKGKNEKPVQVDVITLELTPEEAEKLAHATTQGRIQLALRNYNNTEEVFTRGATIPTLLTGQGTQSKPMVKKMSVKGTTPVAKPAAMSFTVEVLRGSERTTKTFNVEKQ
jgi:pilus assembly protein CpaB